MNWERAGWLVGAVVLGLVLLLRTRAFAAKVEPDQAAVGSVRGDLAIARSLVDARLKTNPGDAQALFVLACIHLQEGDLAGARAVAGRFAVAKPGAPESEVLLALVEERERPQPRSWADSFLSAVRRSRSPVTPTVFAASPGTQQKIERGSLQGLSPADRLLVEYALSDGPPTDEQVRAALELSKTSDLTVAVGLTAYSVLSFGPSSGGEEQVQAAGRVIRQLAAAHPDLAYLRLAAVLQGTSKDAPLSADEIAQIGDAVADRGTPLKRPLGEIYSAFKAALTKVDAPAAHELAFGATMGPYAMIVPNTVLAPRAKATAKMGSPRHRADLASALAILGRGLSRSSCILDLSFSRMYLALAADLSGDTAMRAEANEAETRFQEMRKRAAFFAFVEEWPIAALQQEFNDRKIQDELALLREANH